MEGDLMLRILTGEANSVEKEKFYENLKNSKEDEELFYEVQGLWLRSSMIKNSIDLDSEFNMLMDRIRRSEKQNLVSIGKRIMKYAAIALLMVGLGGLSGYIISKHNSEGVNSGFQKYSALKGSVSVIEFADGTKVWLNSGSQLSYREDHKNKQRLAELKGEAFFEVTHRDDFPLNVKVGEITVRDLGTTFNIKAYPSDKTVETSLVDGKADILDMKGNMLLALSPGESVVYNAENKMIAIKPIQENVLSAWRDGKFVIRDQRLEDIFKELSRWYDVEFRFNDQTLRDFRYTGNIKKSTTAQQVLKMLKLTANFRYKIIENPITPDIIIIY